MELQAWDEQHQRRSNHCGRKVYEHMRSQASRDCLRATKYRGIGQGVLFNAKAGHWGSWGWPAEVPVVPRV